MATSQSQVQPSYSFKASPWSSHSQILSLFSLHGAGRSVLDVGCWDGSVAARLADRGYRVTGLERQSWPEGQFPENVELIVADLHHGIPPLPGRFDYILCADVIEHLLEDAKVMRQLRALLAPGGRLIVSVPNSGNFYFRAMILLGRFPQDDKGLFDRTHIHFRVWPGWRDLFADSGYTISTVLLTPVPFTILRPSPNRLLRGLEWLFWKLACVWKTLFAYQFVFVLESPHE
jgi:SAM-dependent methyltransferase